MHSSLSSVAQFWQAALVGRERLVGGDVGHRFGDFADAVDIYEVDDRFEGKDSPRGTQRFGLGCRGGLLMSWLLCCFCCCC